MLNEPQPAQTKELTVISPFDVMFDDNKFLRLEKISELMASGRSTIPKHLQGNVGDCFAITMQALRWGIDPYAAAQKTHLINGVIGYEAQLVNAIIIKNAPITGRPNYEWFGPWEKIIGKFKKVTSKTKKDDNGNFKEYIVPDWDINDEKGLGIRVSATIKGEAQPRVLELLLTQVRTRNSTLWTEDPKQQIAYLSIKRWSRLHTPDVTMGVYTPDELDDIGEPIEKEVNPIATGTDEKTNDILGKINKGKSKPPIDHADVVAQAEVALSEVMTAITSANNKETLEQAKAMMFKLTGEDRATADTSYRNKVDELKRLHEEKIKAEVQPNNWEHAIKECGDTETLTKLLADMPEADQLTHQDLIDNQFDSLR
ncbi:MAG: RecT family recombinase [Methylobacter sp.]|nr:RecT family recombinase [Methylobacter sp.]